MGILDGVPFTIAIYNDFNLSIDTIAFVSLVSGGSFQTEIDGGFSKCSVSIDLKREFVYQWFTKALGKRCRLYSSDGSIVHEGRIERTNITNRGIVLDSLGLFVAGNDTLMGLIYPISTPTSASEVVEDAIDLISFWTKHQFVTTTTDVTPLDFFGDVKVNQAIVEVLKYGDDDIPPNAMHFQVWAEGLASLVTEPSDISLEEPSYIIKVGQTKKTTQYTSTLSIEKVYNKIQALFDHPDTGQTFTDPFEEDADSQVKWGVRTGTINAGEVPESLADTIAEIALEAHKDPEQTRGATIKVAQNKVISGNSKPLHLLRAGDVILLDEVSPYGVSGLSDPVKSTGSTKAIVAKTSYNISTATMSITPGSKTKTFEMLMAQLGISGVSVT